ncbi:hypothetical protein QL285_062584 [Trifolium repens]|nr:hypothetical protein QL285_062584 [Trifolium repens]
MKASDSNQKLEKNEVKVATPRRHPTTPRRSYDHFNTIHHCLLTPRRKSVSPRRKSVSPRRRSDLQLPRLPRLPRPGAGLPRPGVRLRVYSLYKPKNHILLGFRDFYIELRENTVLGFGKPCSTTIIGVEAS